MEHPPDDQPSDVTYLAMIFEGGLIAVALVVGWLVGTDPLAGLYWTPETLPQHGWAVVWGLAATLPMVAALLLIDRFPIGPLRGLKQVVDGTLIPLFAQADIAMLALISMLAGVGEELLFRGLIQAALADWIGGEQGIWIALCLASIVFGVCHWITRTYAVLATLVGLYLGALFLWTGSLLAPDRCPCRLRLHRAGVSGLREARESIALCRADQGIDAKERSATRHEQDCEAHADFVAHDGRCAFQFLFQFFSSFIIRLDERVANLLQCAKLEGFIRWPITVRHRN